MLEISPEASLIDESFSIRLHGLKPNSRVRLSAKTKDLFNQTWGSSLEARADALGELNFDANGLDPRQLIATMHPIEKSAHKTAFIPADEKNVEILFEAEVGEQLFLKSIRRSFLKSDIDVREVNENGVRGRYFVPFNASSAPAILLVSGSDGGIASQLNMAALLASHGYPVFVMAYFNYEGLNKELYDLPLRTFLAGVEWLRGQAEVDAGRIAAIGPSKGAEGLLAAAAYLPQMQLSALVAISPSSVVWQGIGRGRPKPQASWSFNGKPLDYLSMSGEKIFPQFMWAKCVKRLGLQKYLPGSLRMNLSAAYSNVKKSASRSSDAVIPVEKIQAPLCVVAGGDDKLWPSEYMAKMIQARRQNSHFSDQDSFLFYKEAGHQFRVPNLPTSITWRAPKNGGMIINFGGKPEAISVAQRDAWQKILAFLSDNLA